MDSLLEKWIAYFDAFILDSGSNCAFDNKSDSECHFRTRSDFDGISWEEAYEMEILCN